MHTDVLVVGAGPVGLTAAAELRRRGVSCRVIDKLPARLPYAKAVGIQPRTLEIWDRMGLARAAADVAVPMRGQLTYVDGAEHMRFETGRVFVAGDAAHIHPPTGAQGMNTGIQDAVNLAWKLALAVAGTAHPRLLDSYDAERRPVGEEVVGRTVRHATAGGVQADPEDPATLMLREAQLLVAYPDSPIVGPRAVGLDGPGPGDRAPDCGGLVGTVATFPERLFDVLRDHEGHTLLLYADDRESFGPLAELAARTRRLTHGMVRCCAVLGADAGPNGLFGLPVRRDSRGEFHRLYAAQGPTAFLIRPDGCLGLRLAAQNTQELSAYLSGVFGAPHPR